ncbi:MAG: hypothetical protein ABR548_01550 [Actinomycetota bacterium]|nr:carboxypeptidase-like regulatory domain-containing protein [Actinomycetota bacterium]
MRAIRVAAAVSVLIGLLGFGPARAEGSGSIGGTVTGEGGIPLAGFCVTAGDPWNYQFGYAETAADGSYSIAGLEDGNYAVVFDDCGNNTGYLTEWWNDEDSYWYADSIEISGGSASTGVDAQLSLGGYVTGTLTNDEGGEADTCVAAFSVESYEVLATSYASGAYRVGPLPSGDVSLRFGDCDIAVERERYWFPNTGDGVLGRRLPAPQTAPMGYVPEWFDDKDDFGDPVPVVSGADTPGIDAVLEIAGGINGVVTDEAGEPLQDMCVESFDNGYGFGRTDENGFYTITQLAAGSHKVAFFDCDTGVFRSEWYDNQPSDILANPVSVVRKTWTNRIDAALAKRPMPDLAIASLRVTSVPIEVDDVSVAASPWRRTITLGLANKGTALPGDEAGVRIWAVSGSDHHVQEIATDEARVAPGTVSHRTYDWDGLGTLGDVTIYASVCSYDDSNRQNNDRHVGSYVGVGGLGVGIRPGQNTFFYPGYCYREVVVVAAHS